MKRLLLWIFVVLLVVLAAGAGIVGYAVSTEEGLKWLLSVAVEYMPGRVDIKTVHGRLIGPISVSGVRYSTEDFTIALDKLYLDWMPYFLSSGEIYITKLDVRGVSIESTAKKKAPPRKRLPEIRLPVNIAVKNAFIKDIRIVRADTAPPLVVEELSFGISTGWNTIYISSLDLKAPLFTVTLKGKVRPRGDYPLSLQTEWLARPEGYPDIKGGGAFEGTIKKLKIKQKLSAPFRAELDADIADALGEMKWQAHLAISGFNAHAIKPGWPAMELDGAIRGSGSLATFQTAGAFTVSGTDYSAGPGKIAGSFLLNRLKEKWRLERLVLSTAGSNARLALSGEYSVSGNKKFAALNGHWKDITWPLQGGKPLAGSPGGKFSIGGFTDDYKLDMDIEVRVAQVPATLLTLSGRGNLSSLDIGMLRAKLLKGELNGSGSVAWKPSLAWQVSLRGAGLDPGAAWPEWPGRLAIEAGSSGTFKKGRLQGIMDIRSIKGKLRGYPLRAATRLRVDGTAYALSGLEISSGSAQLSASGRLADTLDFKWKISAPQLGTLVPKSRGAVFSHGTLTGPRETPCIRASVEGKGITYKRYRVDNLKTGVRLDMQDRLDSRLDIKAAGVYINRRYIEALAVQGAGKISAHQFNLLIKAKGEAASALLQGGYENKIWNGMLRKSGLASGELGEWSLEQPGPLMINFRNKNIEAGRWCWNNASSRLCLQADWKGEAGSRGNISVERIPFALLQPLLSPGMKINGIFDGAADVKYAEGTLAGQVRFRTSSGSVSFPLTDRERSTVSFKESLLEATLTKSGFDARLNVPMEKSGIIKGALTLPDFSPFNVDKNKQPVRGSLYAETSGLGIVSVLYAGVENTSGLFRADVLFSGTLAKPSFSGKAAVEQGAANVPRLGIGLRDVRLELSGTNKGSAAISGQARSGPGIITMEGKATLDPQEKWDVNIHLKGRNFEAAKIPEAQVIASPDLDLSVKGYRIDITGEVTIPQAAVKPPEKSKVVPVSQDVVVVNGLRQVKKEEKWKVYSRVRIVPGEKVTFNGYGLSGLVRGGITAVEEPQQLTTATGELQIVNGQYKAYGQTLNIDRGRLVFAGGPISDPALDMRVVRKVSEAAAGKGNEVVVGINVQGSLKHPRTNLFSSPAMDQADILSYLILGRPMQSASGEEGRVLYNAARSLSLTGGEFLAKRIGSVFGIREVRIEQGTKFEEASLVLGAYLSPRLYVGYGIGLFEPISRLRIRYDISKKLQVQVESGTQSGVDLFYKIER